MSKRNKTYFMKPGNDQTLFRVDKNKAMYALVYANWDQIQSDFDRQVKLHAEAVKSAGLKAKFSPAPIQLVLSNDEMEKVAKAISVNRFTEGPIKVFYNSEQFHLCSFINETKAKKIGEQKNKEDEEKETIKVPTT